MLALAARFLEDLPQVGGYHGVGGEDEGGLVVGGVDCGGVDVLGLCDCCGEDVFEGREGFGLVFGDGGGDDFEIGEADLWKGCVSFGRSFLRAFSWAACLDLPVRVVVFFWARRRLGSLVSRGSCSGRAGPEGMVGEDLVVLLHLRHWASL